MRVSSPELPAELPQFHYRKEDTNITLSVEDLDSAFEKTSTSRAVPSQQGTSTEQQQASCAEGDAKNDSLWEQVASRTVAQTHDRLSRYRTAISNEFFDTTVTAFKAAKKVSLRKTKLLILQSLQTANGVTDTRPTSHEGLEPVLRWKLQRLQKAESPDSCAPSGEKRTKRQNSETQGVPEIFEIAEDDMLRMSMVKFARNVNRRCDRTFSGTTYEWFDWVENGTHSTIQQVEQYRCVKLPRYDTIHSPGDLVFHQAESTPPPCDDQCLHPKILAVESSEVLVASS